MKEIQQNSAFIYIKKLVILCCASLLMAVNINTFIHTGGLYPGGATGMTVLVQRIAEKYWSVHIPYTVINIIMNAFPVYIGFRFLGKKFTLYSLLVIMLTNIFTDLLPTYVITYDTLLISIFGGMINGLVISMCLMENATTGGLDFISMYFNVRKGVDGFNVSLGVNVIILGCAGIVFGWDKALYSIILQYMSTSVVHMLYQRFQQHTLLIVTSEPDRIAEKIHEICHHGATILSGEGAYEGVEKKIVYSVISSNDRVRVTKAVKEIDPKAFVNVIKTDRIQGRFYQEPTE